MKYNRKESGFYSVNPEGAKQFKVFCDLSSDEGGWTVIQRRIFENSELDYHTKTWQDYRDGFGNNAMSFWLGNNYIHELTKTPQRLKITISTRDLNTYEANYESFVVKDEASEFAIDFGYYSGETGSSVILC